MIGKLGVAALFLAVSAKEEKKKDIDAGLRLCDKDKDLEVEFS